MKLEIDQIKQIDKYGHKVYCNVPMDDLRKEQCLCLNCEKLPCVVSKSFFELCKSYNIALMITRCPEWEAKNKPYYWYEDTSGWPVYNARDYKEGKKDPLKEINIGDEVAVQSMIGYCAAKVTSKSINGDYIAETEDCLFPLGFNKEKGYWVCSISMHKKGLENIK
jgi:hypothetical protein